MEKKKNTMELTESKLLDFIEEGVKQTLKEYRGETYNDGDLNYTRPNGENNIGTGLNFSNYGKEGKRALTNMTMKDGGKLKTVSVNTRTVFHHGKGDICNRLLHMVKDAFYGNDKIEWTDAEKKEIEEILSKIGALAALTKKEGNKKRGYNGPKEESKEMNEEFDLDNFSETTPPDAFEYDDNELNEGDKFEMFTKFLRENDKAREVVEGCVEYVSRGLDRGRNQDTLLGSAADEIMTNCIDDFCEEYNTEMGLDYNEEQEFKEKLKRFILDNIADDMLPDNMRMNEESIRSYTHNIAKKHKH